MSSQLANPTFSAGASFPVQTTDPPRVVKVKLTTANG